jgi:hypothetical protein
MDFFSKTTQVKREPTQKKKKLVPTKKKAVSNQDDCYLAANSDAFRKSLQALMGHYKTQNTAFSAWS